MGQLQQTMTSISANAAAVRSGSKEINKASDNLARRSEQTAASLEQSAAALDRITATVRKSAEGAQEARVAVRAAKSGAEMSGLVVRNTVQAMGEIGHALQEIVSQVTQLNSLVDEIAAAAQRQAIALGEVNSAVNQMDEATQHNAAMVEQATAASSHQAAEADELAQLVARFETGTPARLRSRAPPAAQCRAWRPAIPQRSAKPSAQRSHREALRRKTLFPAAKTAIACRLKFLWPVKAFPGTFLAIPRKGFRRSRNFATNEIMLFHASCAARPGSGDTLDAALLLGPPGSGKSDLLLRLIHRGWVMVADDQVHVENGMASPPAALAGVLEVRGLGLFRLPFAPAATLRLAVNLGIQTTRLPGPEHHEPLGLPLITIDPAQISAPERLSLALDAATGRVQNIAGAFAA
jgi:HPr kinase/phosphorylase